MNEAEIVIIMKVKAHRDAAEVLKPCEEPLNLPPSLVAPQ
jgi:hypothetical protein